MTQSRIRFAPSPTGDLHIGGARTALFCFLQARRMQGRFILRMENTDIERSSQLHAQSILEGLNWLGIEWDEGPIYQTERFPQYKKIIAQLLAEDKAYRCNCSPQRLQKSRENQLKARIKPRYDRHCRDLHLPGDTAGHVVRFKTPTSGKVEFNDLIRGRVRFANDELDDLIISRSDGSPTYNLCVVVDDIDMGISQVIRGEDHLTNTPRQIHIFAALGASLPEFAHVPMILGEDGRRLSKRHGATSVLQYREMGYLPEAMANAIVRLGWSHGDQEIFSLSELQKLFDIRNVNKAAARFEGKRLNWINQQHIKQAPISSLCDATIARLTAMGISISTDPDLAKVIELYRERVHTLAELADKSRIYYADIECYDVKAVDKHFRDSTAAVLQDLHDLLTDLGEWEKTTLLNCVKSCATRAEISLGKVAQPLRVAICGIDATPAIDDTLFLLGRARVLQRLRRSIEYIRQSPTTKES